MTAVTHRLTAFAWPVGLAALLCGCGASTLERRARLTDDASRAEAVRLRPPRVFTREPGWAPTGRVFSGALPSAGPAGNVVRGDVAAFCDAARPVDPAAPSSRCAMR